MSDEASETGQRYNGQPILKRQKPILPYICSTLDFQEERDFLAKSIFPRLNDICSSRGTYFKAVDLRWSAVKAHKSFTSNQFRQYSCLQSQHLKLSLDYVNRCFPFFIGLLGQTYGDFLPDYTPFLLSQVKDFESLSKGEQNLYIAAKNGYPWVLKTPNCSLTEFEIIQAVFRKKSQFQFFYFRTSNSLLRTFNEEEEEEEEKLSSAYLLNEQGKMKVGKLKAKIIGKGLPVRFYRDLEELGDMVWKDWSAVVEKLYPFTTIMGNIDYKHSFENLYHEEFVENCKQVFVTSKESNRTFEILERFAIKDLDLDLDTDSTIAGSGLDSILRINSLPTCKSILLLSGERGCGKSTLIANWVSNFQSKHPGVLMIPYFVGSTCESCDIMSVIHYFVMELQHRANGPRLEMDFLNEDSNVLVFSLLVEVFIAAISLKPCILVLDGIEELIGIYGISGQKAKDFSWLPRSLPPHCKFILSSVSSSLSCKSLCARPDVKIVELNSIGDEDTKFNIFRQHLSPADQERFGQSKPILRKKPNLSPLKLAIIASELQECKIYRNEFQCLREYLEVASVQELWELILKRWVEDYSWTLKPKDTTLDTVIPGPSGWVVDVLCLLCISHCGLAEDELLQLLDTMGYRDHHKVTAVHWAAFRQATKTWIQEKPNGLLYFQHQSLRSAVEHKLLGVSTPVRESNPNVAQNSVNHKKAHFHQVLMRFFQRQTIFWRVYQELPWHMKMSGYWEGLCNFITNPSITDFISKIQNPSLWTRLHLVHYWDVLLEAGNDVSEAFLLSVAKIEGEQFQKLKKRTTLSVLECSLSEITAADKGRIILFIGSFLKLMGKINEAEKLFLSAEDLLLQSPSMTEMLLRAQNAIGELYLEIGMTPKGLTYFQKAWSNLLRFTLSDLKISQELMKQKVKVMNNLAKSAPGEFLKENHVLEYATEISKYVTGNPRDHATMKYTEGVLMLASGNAALAKLKFQECLTIRRWLFGNKNILVGEIMEFLADLLFFLLGENEKSQKKQAIEYYKQVIKIKEKADTVATCKLVRKHLSISLSDTLCKLGQLLSGDFCHHATMEAVSYLYRSLDLRAAHLGPTHASIEGILHLLREIQRSRGRRSWPQSMNHLFPNGSRNGFSLWENVPKLNFHSAQSSDTVNTAMCMNIRRFQRVKSTQPSLVSDKPKYVPGKGKKTLAPILCKSAEEKFQRQASDSQIWNSPRRQPARKKAACPLKTVSLIDKNGLVRLSRQSVSSAELDSRKGLITSICRQPLQLPHNVDNPWKSISELVSEKWLFHTPQYCFTPQKPGFPRRSQIESKLLKTSDDPNKE
ncbi:tetratricopeptide repeat protein 41 isoform X2 [Mus musculus]|uniref:tetratricopeptide repeat protein 41 isoform X2 n=2 Tax=Mus musculus TaxID=10090 RepID=UPI0003D7058E|nr:tetratricopeptide repeat protein 41 isoform X2 [Mus musculus]|eukprot:XP_006513063.1 PREDICTED: tetratricopeptide repeat protein 41 isoform X2 [Mus musculus]